MRLPWPTAAVPGTAPVPSPALAPALYTPESAGARLGSYGVVRPNAAKVLLRSRAESLVMELLTSFVLEQCDDPRQSAALEVDASGSLLHSSLLGHLAQAT